MIIEETNDFIITPDKVKEVWANSRPKNALLDHLQNYFKPRSSFEPERIDYNALLIIAEFQIYNLEFAKNQLFLNDRQTACLLDFFWQLLEFDPDRSVKSPSHLSVCE